MWKLKNWNNNKGFTIVELAVTIGIIAVLSGIGLVAFSKLTATNQQTQCINNLREISQGLQLYHNDFRTFPDDGYPDDADDLYPLSTDLAVYLPTKSIFVCPEDEDTTSISDSASYDPYYVARPASYQNEELVIGCPRHSNASSSTSLFSMGSTELTNIDTVLATRSGDEQTMPPDGTKAQRTISAVNDKMTFADGSTVTLTDASGLDYGCFLIQSVRLADGTLYSIVRVQDDGTIDVSVTPGSKFEIVTPSAVVGVRGTKFDVVTTNGGNTTDVVNLTEGTVILMNRVTGETTTLTLGGLTTASAAINTHSHMHWHANGTYHNDLPHPNLNLAHHGNPALAMKAASGASGGGGEEDPEISPEDQDLINYINTVNDSYKNIRDYLVAASSPDGLSDAVLLALINKNPPLLTSSYIRVVFEANVPLSDTVWLAMIAVDDIMLSAAYGQVFDAHSTLSDTVLIAAIDKGTIMLDTAWQNALVNKSPLSENVLITLANSSTTMSSNSYEWVFESNSPLTDNVLIAAINKGTIMDTDDYDWLLTRPSNLPLSDAVLLASINKATYMDTSEHENVFTSNYPLSEGVLDAMINKDSLMVSNDYATVLVGNSPLPSNIWTQVCAGTPLLDPSDLDLVKAVNPACP